MTDLNPYASPSHVETEQPLGPEPQLGNVVANTGRVMLGQWSPLLITLVLICLPWEMFDSYAAEHWFEEEDAWQEFVLSLVGEFTLLLYAQGFTLTAACLQLQQRERGLATIAAQSLAAFPALLLSGLLSFLAIGLGCVLGGIPGLYLNIRWMYYGPAAVAEEISGVGPLQRSWELTRSRFMFSLTVFALFCLPMIAVGVALQVLISFSPTLQYWPLTAAVNTVGNFVDLIVCIGFACGYHELLRTLPKSSEMPQYSDSH